MSQRKRIGIMGGTFDPVHMVHLTLAENAYQSYHLDEVMMLPNGDPPHKTDKKITPAVHRMAMLQLAVEGIPYFQPSDMEIKREGYSYSSVTLEALKKAHPDTEYYFIMGADSLFEIETWHEPDVIMSDCVILAAMRNHTPDDLFKNQMSYLIDKYHADIRFLNIPDLALSSSEIRRRVRNHQSIRFMVPESVRAYIEEHQLYSDRDEGRL